MTSLVRAAFVVAPIVFAAAASMQFHIKGGEHGATKGGITSLQIGWHVDRTVRFKAVFHSNVPYATRTPSNQLDWNKLMGFTTNRIHHNSIRLGWRWRPDLKKVEVGHYGYIQGARTMLPLTTVELDAPLDVEIKIWNDGQAVRAGAAAHTEARSLGLSGWIPTMTWLLKTAYFGGDETAPHDLDISVTEIRQ